ASSFASAALREAPLLSSLRGFVEGGRVPWLPSLRSVTHGQKLPLLRSYKHNKGTDPFLLAFQMICGIGAKAPLAQFRSHSISLVENHCTIQ
ncbi:MAG: hypothetical protein LBT53_03760, partial [Puniceicoccales bacterium]|nr:hypothetical protein [Puniceicoccales bacterium]